jgi:hypothetical protein
MNLLGTTGTRHIAESDAPKHVAYLKQPLMHLYLMQFDGFVSGGCIGWDAVFGKTMAQTYPDKQHVVIVPAKRDKVDYWWHKFDPGFVKVIEMPQGSDYRDRNEQIVKYSHHLFYCAQYPEQHGASKRSGTWMTVRIAKDAGRPVDGIVINPETS